MSLGAELSSDYFLKNPPRQPKKEVADYVESYGIAVPRRFPILADALASGKPFIMRSEHPQDYTGASGLVDSHVFKPNEIPTESPLTEHEIYRYRTQFSSSSEWTPKFALLDHLEAKVKELPQNQVENWMTFLSRWPIIWYGRLNGIDPEKFKNSISYSYWELIDGLNQSVVADSSVPNRYHVYTKQGRYGHGSYIFEDGRVVEGAGYKLPTRTNQEFQSLVDFYESVRNLPRFSSNHCPLVEVQTQGPQHFFLQYLRTRDFHPADFSLDRSPIDEGFEAMRVRGATPPEGLKLTMQIYYRDNAQVHPEAGLDYTSFRAFVETLARKTRVLIISERRYPNAAFLNDDGHLRHSSLFKPEVSMILDRDDIAKIRGFEVPELRNPFPQVPIVVVSDGRKAYVKRG